jgi:hypothetical protein
VSVLRTNRYNQEIAETFDEAGDFFESVADYERAGGFSLRAFEAWFQGQDYDNAKEAVSSFLILLGIDAILLISRAGVLHKQV